MGGWAALAVCILLGCSDDSPQPVCECPANIFVATSASGATFEILDGACEPVAGMDGGGHTSSFTVRALKAGSCTIGATPVDGSKQETLGVIFATGGCYSTLIATPMSWAAP